MIKVTEQNAHKYHRYMWRWLARHADRDASKKEWPGWRVIENTNSHCFACILADKRLGDIERHHGSFAHCTCCPIKEWREQVVDGTRNCEPACLIGNSVFDKWESDWDDENVSMYATTISEMEWE